MSCSIKFVRLDDFIADVDVLDLSANGYSLAQDGYFPTAAPLGAKSVREVITLKLQGTSKDDLAAMTQEIDEKIKQVEWWLNDPGVERYQVWIRVQLENESLPRQAQIISIQPPDSVRVFTPEERLDNFIGDYQIGIERTPYWEALYPYPTTTAVNNLNIIGGMSALSETINGDVPARLARLTGTLDASSGRLDALWMGWKTSRFGTPANFIPVWSLYLGTPIDADTSETADATTYAGVNKVTTSFSADATLILRDVIFLTPHVTVANIADQRGSYSVLLRAKMSDTSVARVRMVAGLYSGGAFQSPVYRSRQVVSGTAWSFFELGNCKIPPSRLPPNYNFGNFSIGIYAERISGAGALDMDCLVLIPIDDSAVKLTSSGSLNNTHLIEVFQAADDKIYATGQKGSGESIFTVVPRPQNDWSLPANNEAPVLVIAGNDTATGCVKGKTLDITYAYIPRWRVLRGNDT